MTLREHPYLVLSCVLAGCEPAPVDPQPRVDGAILEVAGVHITRAQLDDYAEYFHELDPRLGRKLIVRELLAQHLLPLAFAERDFPAERAEQLSRARDLASVAQNYLELRERGAAYDGAEPEEPFARTSLPFPLARYAFREENLGRTSEPLATARGYALIAPRDLVRGGTTTGDLCHAYLVGFPTHSDAEFALWLQEAKLAARGAVTFVADEYADSLPIWLEP